MLQNSGVRKGNCHAVRHYRFSRPALLPDVPLFTRPKQPASIAWQQR